MNREEFDKLYLGKAVHCNTEKKAKEFLALADNLGYKWVTKMWLINYNQWERYKEETCYEVTRMGVLFGDVKFYKDKNYQVIEYQSQLKFKAGDKVRVNNTLYPSINGKVGVIERVDSLSIKPYAVKIDRDSWLWYLTENELEKVKEPTYKEETIDDIIDEIKEYQERITVLLNRLEQEMKK